MNAKENKRKDDSNADANRLREDNRRTSEKEHQRKIRAKAFVYDNRTH